MQVLTLFCTNYVISADFWLVSTRIREYTLSDFFFMAQHSTNVLSILCVLEKNMVSGIIGLNFLLLDAVLTILIKVGL